MTAKLKKELDKSKQLLRIPLGAITIGFLVFTPEIVVDVSLEGLIRIEVEYTATQTLNYEVGVQYNSSTKSWTKINTFKNSFSHESPSFEAEVEASAKLTASARLMLYGIAGVEADVGVYASFQGQYPAFPAWKLRGGIEGNVGVDLDLIVLQEELNAKIFGKEWSIAQAPNMPPTFEQLKAQTVCADGTTPHTVLDNGKSVVKLKAVTDDLEDGKGQGTIEWSTSLGGTLGTTLPGSKHNPGFDLKAGTQTIKAFLTDSKGRGLIRTFQITVTDNNHCTLGEPLPAVKFINIIENAVPIMDDSRTLTFKAHTEGGLNGCCVITWTSDLEGELGTTIGTVQADFSRSHSFTHTFKFQTPQVITATVTQNGHSTSDTQEVSAYPISTTDPLLSTIQPNAPSNSRYVYLDDTVSFGATSNGTSPEWTSSDPTDSINGKTGTNVSMQFKTTGPRTITASSQNNDGGFSSQTYRVNVLSALARP